MRHHLRTAWRAIRCALSGYRVVVVSPDWPTVHPAVSRADALRLYRLFTHHYRAPSRVMVSMYHRDRLCARRLSCPKGATR